MVKGLAPMEVGELPDIRVAGDFTEAEVSAPQAFVERRLTWRNESGARDQGQSRRAQGFPQGGPGCRLDASPGIGLEKEAQRKWEFIQLSHAGFI